MSNHQKTKHLQTFTKLGAPTSGLSTNPPQVHQSRCYNMIKEYIFIGRYGKKLIPCS